MTGQNDSTPFFQRTIDSVKNSWNELDEKSKMMAYAVIGILLVFSIGFATWAFSRRSKRIDQSGAKEELARLEQQAKNNVSGVIGSLKRYYRSFTNFCVNNKVAVGLYALTSVVVIKVMDSFPVGYSEKGYNAETTTSVQDETIKNQLEKNLHDKDFKYTGNNDKPRATATQKADAVLGLLKTNKAKVDVSNSDKKLIKQLGNKLSADNKSNVAITPVGPKNDSFTIKTKTIVNALLKTVKGLNLKSISFGKSQEAGTESATKAFSIFNEKVSNVFTEYGISKEHAVGRVYLWVDTNSTTTKVLKVIIHILLLPGTVVNTIELSIENATIAICDKEVDVKQKSEKSK